MVNDTCLGNHNQHRKSYAYFDLQRNRKSLYKNLTLLEAGKFAIGNQIKHSSNLVDSQGDSPSTFIRYAKLPIYLGKKMPLHENQLLFPASIS